MIVMMIMMIILKIKIIIIVLMMTMMMMIIIHLTVLLSPPCTTFRWVRNIEKYRFSYQEQWNYQEAASRRSVDKTVARHRGLFDGGAGIFPDRPFKFLPVHCRPDQCAIDVVQCSLFVVSINLLSQSNPIAQSSHERPGEKEQSINI